MPKPENNRLFLRGEIEIIAADLNVPESKRAQFVDEAMQLSDFLEEFQGFEQYLPSLRSLEAIEPLIRANQEFKRVIDCLQENWFALNRNTSIDFRRKLAQLLDHPNASAILPELTFVTFDEIPQMGNFLKEKVKKTDAEDGTSITYSNNPATTLVNLLNLLQTALAAELEGRRKNSGGRPPKWVRGHCIKELQSLHDSTFDKPATTTPCGPFSNMCHFLFESFGQSTDGLDEAIKRFLRKQSS
jgi:hypothetical protein